MGTRTCYPCSTDIGTHPHNSINHIGIIKLQLEQPISGYNGIPQKENGYTPIANELLEAILLHPFTSRQKSIIFAICRVTYGYSKKKDAISGWQLSKMTNIDRSHVSKTLDELIKNNVIIRHETGRNSHGILVNDLSINKLYETWITVAESATVAKTAPLPKNQITVAELAQEPLPKQPTHKAIQKQENKYMSEFNSFWIRYPKKESKKKSLEIWVKIKPDLLTVMKALDWQIIKWAKDNNKYCPLPTSYLNQARWEDENPISKNNSEVPEWKRGLI